MRSEKNKAMGTIEVIRKFCFTSLVMWASPLLILFVFNKQLFPGISNLSPRWHTLLSGFLAIVSVNVVIGVYIFLAMKEPSSAAGPQPDPKFASKARASLQQANQEDNASSQADGGKKDD